MTSFKTNEKYFILEDTIELFKLKSIGRVFDIKRFIVKYRNDCYITEIIQKNIIHFNLNIEK